MCGRNEACEGSHPDGDGGGAGTAVERVDPTTALGHDLGLLGHVAVVLGDELKVGDVNGALLGRSRRKKPGCGRRTQ